jgi:hypothetical protein
MAKNKTTGKQPNAAVAAAKTQQAKNLMGGSSFSSNVQGALDKTKILGLIGSIVAPVLGRLSNAGATGKYVKDTSAATNYVKNILGEHDTAGRHQAAIKDADAIMDALNQTINDIQQDSRYNSKERVQLIKSAINLANKRLESIQYTSGIKGNAVIGNTVHPSDSRAKNIKPHAGHIVRALRDDSYILSDDDYKRFGEADPMEIAKAILDHGRPYSAEELEFLHSAAKKLSGDDYTYDIKNVGIWSPKTLDGYAKYIKNSVYNYKPEAQEIDPSIDPSVEHIGPMAQEIEKVNPAAIIETEEGVKTVDTGRLSLMNAGAIGDLARQNIQQGKAIELLAAKVGV